MFVVVVALALCKSYCNFFIYWFRISVYTTAKLPCKQTGKSEEDLLKLYFCDLFQNHDIVYVW